MNGLRKYDTGIHAAVVGEAAAGALTYYCLVRREETATWVLHFTIPLAGKANGVRELSDLMFAKFSDFLTHSTLVRIWI